MGLKIKAIICFICSLICFSLMLLGLVDDGESGNQIGNAIYIPDGKIVPENEGKLIMVGGSLAMIEGVTDE